MTLSNEQREEIRRALSYGASKSDLAEEYGVSGKTIQRIKKELPDDAPAQDRPSDNPDIEINSNTIASKSELRFIKKYTGEISLYEDREEGWVYHLTASDYRMRQSGRWWMAICYPESSDIKEVIERFDGLGISYAVSPLHDKDVWDHDSAEQVDAKTGEIVPKGALYKAGDPKKSHYHIIIVFEKRMSAREVNNIIRPITNGPYLQKCHSLRNAYDYFTHLNDPKKFQFYDKKDIICGGGFHIEPTNYEKGMMINEIVDIILEKEIDSWRELMEECNEVEYRNLITARPGAFTRLIQENWSSHHPDGKIQRMRIVEKDEEE